MSPQVQLIAIFAGIPLALVLTAFWLHWSGNASLRRMQSGVADVLERARTVERASGEPLVRIRFHVYSGCVVLVQQSRIEAELPGSSAKTALRELMWLNFDNLRHYPGAVWVPLLTWIEYMRQARFVEGQLRQTAGADREC